MRAHTRGKIYSLIYEQSIQYDVILRQGGRERIISFFFFNNPQIKINILHQMENVMGTMQSVESSVFLTTLVVELILCEVVWNWNETRKNKTLQILHNVLLFLIIHNGLLSLIDLGRGTAEHKRYRKSELTFFTRMSLNYCCNLIIVIIVLTVYTTE